jgi:hypothetical protein
MPHTIRCNDCGEQVETARKNTKYCSVCRLIRDLPYAAGQEVRIGGLPKCALCAKEFARLDIRDPLCGECAPETRSHGKCVCAFCHEEKHRVRKDIAVCDRCARKKEVRDQLWKSLRNKQRARQAENQVPA